ncbi:glycosyltransferase [Clostridium perfringens]|uniref:glycosyltransferase n=1 Tax=Clostridium perfringens TaxID=1502 RepID=UPI00224641B8|nr:glycosyltransferase [Clostridium perfringens]MCX0383110.1 glycosyltransferase [Clostridium perfringens]
MFNMNLIKEIYWMKICDIIYPPFTVAMSVYEKDNDEYLDRALQSITDLQTIKPDEIVLVCDGPLTEKLDSVIEKYKKKYNFIRIVRLKYNKGLGNALSIAVKESKNELIFRMDSDDVSVNDRFEQQLKFFSSFPDVDIIGGDITEFIGEEENIVGKRHVPEDNNLIREYMKTRCAMNHVSVMYKKSAILAAGGYKDWFWNEDYYLWIRMLLNGAVFANTGTVLVNVRVGKEMYNRRGGIKYFKSELGIQNYMLKNKIIGINIYLINIIIRIIVQILLPNKIRGLVFRTLARERN